MSLPQETLGDRVTLPLLPLRDVVVYPHMVIPLFVGRDKSVKALEKAMEAGVQMNAISRTTEDAKRGFAGWRYFGKTGGSTTSGWEQSSRSRFGSRRQSTRCQSVSCGAGAKGSR